MIFRHSTVKKVRSRNVKDRWPGKPLHKVLAILDRIFIDGAEKAAPPLEERSKVPEVLLTPTPEVVAEILLKPEEGPEPVKTLSVPPPEVVAAVLKLSTPRIKGDIVVYSEESDDNESDHSDDEEETNPKVKFLPPSPKGLRKMFNKPCCELMRQRKHEHQNEQVLLLNEILRQEAISREEYKPLNNFLSEMK